MDGRDRSRTCSHSQDLNGACCAGAMFGIWETRERRQRDLGSPIVVQE